MTRQPTFEDFLNDLVSDIERMRMSTFNIKLKVLGPSTLAADLLRLYQLEGKDQIDYMGMVRFEEGPYRQTLIGFSLPADNKVTSKIHLRLAEMGYTSERDEEAGVLHLFPPIQEVNL